MKIRWIDQITNRKVLERLGEKEIRMQLTGHFVTHVEFVKINKCTCEWKNTQGKTSSGMYVAVLAARVMKK